MDIKLDPGQVSAFMRHVYTAGATGAAIVGGMSLMSPATINTIMTSVHQIGDGIVSICTGVAALIPVGAGLYASWTASHKSKMVAIATDPQTAPQVKQAVTAVLAANAAKP